MYRAALSVLMCSVALLVNAQMMPFGLTGKMMLLGLNEVKKEIKLTKDQQKQIDEYIKTMGDNAASFGLPDMHYMTRQMDKKVEAFLDDSQRERLQQLFLQINGLLTVTEDDVSATLGLSEEVRTSAMAIIKASDKAVMDEMMANRGKFDKKKIVALKDKTTADLTALLTSDQVEKWKTMQGQPFKFPKMGR